MPKSPIQYVRTILCNKSIIDTESNNISLMELLEEITIQLKEPLPEGKPAGFPIQFDVVTFWKKEKEADDAKVMVRLEIIDPKGITLNTHDATFDIPKDKQSMRFIIKMGSLNITTSGIYLFRVSYQEQGEAAYKKVDEIPLSVTLEVLQK